MARFKLVPYSIRIRKKDSNKSLDLNNIPINQGVIDMFAIFKELCTSYTTNTYNRTRERRTLCVIDHKSIKLQKVISGTIKSGEYGYETDFYDTKAGKRIQSARKEEHSEEWPFFFLFHLPKKNRDIGFLILEKFKQYGIKCILAKAISEILGKYSSELIIEINPLLNTKLLESLASTDKLIEIKFIKKAVPKDVADKNLIKNYEDIHEERSFKIKRNRGLLLKVKDDIVKAIKNIDYPYSEIKGEKYDEVKLITKKEGTTSTISIQDIPRFRECMPLKLKNSDLERGFPKEEFLQKKSKEYVNSLLKAYNEDILED